MALESELTDKAHATFTTFSGMCVRARRSTPDLTGKRAADQGIRGDIRTRFKPGRSGNPAGRPKGARSKLGEQFYADMLQVWLDGGREALIKVRDEHPVEYLKVLISILPKDAGAADAVDETVQAMSDEDFASTLGMLQRLVRVERFMKSGQAVELEVSRGSRAPEPG